jgi:drug/metabolite transporter (DMT)-like permease
VPGHARRGYLSLVVSALLFNLVPVFGTAAAVIGLGEQLRAVEVAGGALIVLDLLV